MEQTAGTGDIWCMAEVDIFADLSTQEMEALAAVAPMKTYAAGDLLFTPHQPTETLFILKKGRVRVFRVSADGPGSHHGSAHAGHRVRGDGAAWPADA